MKMSEKYLCCDECFSHICKICTRSAKLWMDICSYYEKTGGIFGLKLPDFEELRTLEHMGFITTTENSDHIVVKMNGIHVDRQGIYFCLGEFGQHEEM